MEEKVIKLELTVSEVNVVLSLVSKGPYEAVYQLVGKIRSQGEAQLRQDQVGQDQEQLNG